MASSRALRAAIIGCGRMAGTIDDEVRDYPGMLFPYGHAGAYQLADGVELVAAADLDAPRLQAFCDRFEIPQRFADAGEMLAAVAPDIVSITTPATARAKLLQLVAQKGVKGVYAEKALACSLAEARSAAAALAERGVAFNIGTSRRYGPGYRAARALIERGEIGEVHTAIAYTPGNLMHTHSHTIDTLLYLLGDPEVEEVQARLNTPVEQVVDGRFPGDPNIAWAQIRCAGGAQAVIQSVPGRYEFELIGRSGAILAYNNGYTATWQLRRPSGRQGGRDFWAAEPFPSVDESMSATLRAVSELVAAVRHGEGTSGNIGVALRQMEVSSAIAHSHVLGGQAVSVPSPVDYYIPSR
ncbi:MAG TPA: Gfo/Idh/MocA family oxidoreductase [Limnochordia bacterium]|nr:Gfo/Idh/MocA family oxidoreductase [Limnochordia bacterium]